jgi:GTP-binding protein
VLLHLVDGSQPDPAGAYHMIRHELAEYGAGLDGKPEIVVLNKLDAMTPQAKVSRVKALERACGRKVLLCSGVTGEGVPEVLRAVMDVIRAR